MTEPYEFVVMLQVKTTDPRLTPKAIDEAMTSAGGVSRLRRAILQHLPKDVSRVIAAMPVEHARLLMILHEAVGDDIATHLREIGRIVAENAFVRPPPDYVPPTTE
jgi:hypothetical protein